MSRDGRSHVDWKRLISVLSNSFTTGKATFAVISIGIVTVVLNVATTIYILHFAVSIVWASRAVSVTPIVVALTTLVFARRVVASATTRWRCRSATRRAITTTAWTTVTTPCVTAGVKPPGCGRRRTGPLSY